MAGAFQSNAVQNNAFQIEQAAGNACTPAFQRNAFEAVAFQTCPSGGITPPAVVTPPALGGAGWKKRRSGIYWPRLGKKRNEQKVVAEVVAAALEQVPIEAVPRQIDVGALAADLIQHNGYQALRQIDTYEQMISLIKRELEEWDDEDALLLLL